MNGFSTTSARILPQAARLAELKRQLPRGVSSGWAASSRQKGEHLSALWRPGMIGEWLTPAFGSGAATLAWRSLADSLPPQGVCAVVNSDRTFLAPAIAGWGVSLNRLLMIHPATPQEGWWAVEQCLRSRGVAATCVWVDRVPERTLRRWQLAAEAGGGIGLLLRPAVARREPSWAAFRVLVTPLATASGEARRMEVEVLYRRGGLESRSQVWELDHDEGGLRLVSPLADSTSLRSATGA